MSFTEAEFEQIRRGCQESAAAVVPAVYEMVKPETVVDVGGGEGWWAREFAALGADALVLDSFSGGAAAELHGEGQVTFWDTDLEGDWLPSVDRVFDLAVCLEVAEHLTPEAGDRLIETLKKMSPVVLFSAAIPTQGGQGHVNEQWPDYWATRFMSGRHGAVYFVMDAIRWLFWDDQRVEPWYRQNMFWAVKAGHPLLQGTGPEHWKMPRRVVHPDIYAWRVAERDRMSRVLYPLSSRADDTDGTVWTGS